MKNYKKLPKINYDLRKRGVDFKFLGIENKFNLYIGFNNRIIAFYLYRYDSTKKCYIYNSKQARSFKSINVAGLNIKEKRAFINNIIDGILIENQFQEIIKDNMELLGLN